MRMRFIDIDPVQQTCFLNTCEAPKPMAGEVLCQVKAFGINRADLLQKQGKYPAPQGASSILGMEVAGVIHEVGEGVDKSLIGRTVCAMITGGGYAEFVCFPAEHLMSFADGMHISHAAAIPEVFLTAYQALFAIGQLEPGQNVLIHAGASGVGTAAIQLAKHWNCKVAVTASSEIKLQTCTELGAEIAINYRECAFDLELKAQGFSPDVIVDVVGKDYLSKNLNILATDGKIVQLAMLGGRYVEQLDMAKMLAKRASIVASTLRNRSDQYKTTLINGFVEHFAEALHTGDIKPVVERVYAVEEINEAHEHMAQNKNIGKLVVSW